MVKEDKTLIDCIKIIIGINLGLLSYTGLIFGVFFFNFRI